jgi:hypothetical protein
MLSLSQSTKDVDELFTNNDAVIVRNNYHVIISRSGPMVRVAPSCHWQLDVDEQMHEQWETGKTPTNVLLHVVYPVKIESSTVQTWQR